LCACIPNHLYKFLTAYSRPKWTGFLIGPATFVHWMMMQGSQAYFFKQCACSEWGCLYPGSVFMLICECRGQGRGWVIIRGFLGYMLGGSSVQRLDGR